MSKVGAINATELAEQLEISVNVIHNLRRRGITWARADELAIQAGFLPWEVWPDWELADPADWASAADFADRAVDDRAETPAVDGPGAAA